MVNSMLDRLTNETIQNAFGGRSLDVSRFIENQAGRILPDAISLASVGSSLNGAGNGELLNGTQVLATNGDQEAGWSQAMQNAEMGQAERLFWILIFSIMVLIAAGGNTIVVYIVSTNKEMKSVTNYFLVNLSLADTMVSTLNVIFNFISMLNSHWPFGKVYCKISNFIAILSISASVFTLTAISCDRYNAILHPLRPRMSHKNAILWILLIWTLSSALAMPNAIFSTVVEDPLADNNMAVTCTMIWPDGRYPLSSHDHIYNIIIMVVTYLVPIITMAILYYKVGKELWGYEAIGENIDKQRRAIMAKKKIVKMMIVVVIIFALCWLPYHAFFVINYYVPTILNDVPLNYQRCYLLMYWLAMSNSMYNPIIIYFMNSKFRHEFRHILCLICCCRVYKPPSRPSVGNITANQNINNTNYNNNNTDINRAHHTQNAFKRQTTLASSMDDQSKLRRTMPVDNNGSAQIVAGTIKPQIAQENGNQDKDEVEIVVTAATKKSNTTTIATTTPKDSPNSGCSDVSPMAAKARHRHPMGESKKELGVAETEPFIKPAHHSNNNHHHFNHQPNGNKKPKQLNLNCKDQSAASEKLIDFANGTTRQRTIEDSTSGQHNHHHHQQQQQHLHHKVWI